MTVLAKTSSNLPDRATVICAMALEPRMTVLAKPAAIYLTDRP
jgi:hypothetical protein